MPAFETGLLLKSNLPPQRPEFGDEPRSSWVPLALVALLAFFCLAAVAIVIVLMLGYSGPILVLALLGMLVFGIFGLQYLIWGRLFERIYRDVPVEVDDIDP